MTSYQLPTKLMSEMKEINEARESKKRRQIVPSRQVQYKGTYKGEKPLPRRIGSDDLSNAPSLFCNTRHYPDGRREKVED